MTKLGLITTYPRLLYSSAAKKDFYSPKRQISCTSSVWKEEQTNPPKNSKESDSVEQKSKDETVKIFDFSKGEIGSKSEKISVGPKNFEEAKNLLLKQYDWTKNQIEEKRDMTRKQFEEKLESVRVIFGATPSKPRTPDEEWYYKRVSFWMKRYENFVGLTEVKAAQARVVERERKFIEQQELRREAQAKITDVQKKIKEIHAELEKTHRGEDRYLVLVTQEHQVLKDEKLLQDEFKMLEKFEREYFSGLSNAVRDSHEKERAQAEKTKYWSVLGSILGTCIGIFGTTINNRMRMNELRRLVSQNNTVEEIRAIGTELREDFSSHKESLEDVIEKADSSVKSLEKMGELCDSMREASQKINVREIDSSLEELRHQQNQLSEVIGNHGEELHTRVDQLMADLISQSHQLEQMEELAARERDRQERLAEARDSQLRVTSESLVQESEQLREMMTVNIKAIEEKMKDVRSLLLHQSQIPKEAEKWLEKVERVEKTQMLLVQKGFDNVNRKLDEAAESRRHAVAAMRGQRSESSELHLMELDNISALLRDHQKRTQQSVLLTGMVVGVLTPAVLYAINKLL